MRTELTDPPIILVPGYWLGAWAWTEVLDELRALGVDADAITLAGLDPDDQQRASRTLDDQAASVERAMSSAGASSDRPVVLVAHSGANGPVSLVLDRHPELVRRVIWVDSGPVAPGTAFDPEAPVDLTELPLPPFEDLGVHASLDGLSAADLERFRDRAVPEPGPVVRGLAELTNPDRRAVPTTIICTSITAAQIFDLARAEHPMFSEVAHLANVDAVDLPTGHWPMWSRPADLATAIATASRA